MIDWAIFERFFFLYLYANYYSKLKSFFLISHKVCDLSSGQNWRHKSQQWWNQAYENLKERKRRALVVKERNSDLFAEICKSCKISQYAGYVFYTRQKDGIFQTTKASRKLNSDTMCWWNRRSHPKHLICISQFITATQPDSGTRTHVPNGFVRWGTRQ